MITALEIACEDCGRRQSMLTSTHLQHVRKQLTALGWKRKVHLPTGIMSDVCRICSQRDAQ